MRYIIILAFFISSTLLNAQENKTAPEDLTGLRAVGSPANPKVKMQWDRYHDNAQITDFCKKLAAAYPELVRFESIGKSYEGRDILMLSVTDFKHGNPDRKPGFYIDGNIHSNELQGSEISMYTAWYLAENYYSVPFIKELLQDKIFYIAPTINPDSRDYFIYQPNTPHSSRTGRRPFDNDGDGLIAEDLYDDLDGDGNIVMMRRKSPSGQWKADPDFPARMIRVAPSEVGEYEMLGFEGIDNDGDGQVNEDITGTYDPNRDWGWNWQPNYIQWGALFYPGTLPETRAVKDFILKHPNIAGAQSYHNYGGMLLRGPGAASDEAYYNGSDVRIYDALAKVGEKVLPGYKYMVIHKDLYTVYGGEIDFLSLGRGIFTFSNELMTGYKMFNSKSENNRQSQEYHAFDKYLLFGDAYVDWKPFDHPQFGPIEIGGAKKNYFRNHPGFLLLEEAHRNMAFTLYHAYHMPKLEIIDIRVEELSSKVHTITATIMNKRMIPTHSAHDIKYKIERPDHIILEGMEVIAGMRVINDDFNISKEQKYMPHRIEIDNIGGMEAVKVRWVAKGNLSNAKIIADSRKGGLAEKKVKE